MPVILIAVTVTNLTNKMLICPSNWLKRLFQKEASFIKESDKFDEIQVDFMGGEPLYELYSDQRDS